jgi:hypothetical protein
VGSEEAAAFSLLSAAAVRERAHRMLALGLASRLTAFHIDLTRLDAAADLVARSTQKAYPTLAVPLHARWRHFHVGGMDRWAAIDGAARWRDPLERARAACDLAIISVLLDAGAGGQWSYHDPASGDRIHRSEGLALASLAMFAAGAFSGDGKDPLRADAQALAALESATLARHLQVSPTNPLLGLEGRAALLRRLGAAVASKPDVFARADGARPGGLFDHLAASARDGCIPAPVVLEQVLRHLGGIWGGLQLGGIVLGDCWRHAGLASDDATSQLVPLHKLAQWLTYSLLEPLAACGIVITQIDGLTGLAEYRNGGLFIDTGVLALRDNEAVAREHDVGSPLVVEWRALTVALLDYLAESVRGKLGCDANSLPLAKVMQGGTWAAGRLLAREKRADGSPPIKVISDGTLF